MKLTNSQYEEIMSIYSERQSANKDIETSRRKEIISTIPEIESIEKEISDLSMEYTISSLEGSHSRDAHNALVEKIKSLSKRKNQLIIEKGYPKDYLDPVYSCNLCKDTGYISDGYPNTKRCDCFNKEITRLFYSFANAKNLNKRETFESFDINKYKKTAIDPKSNKNSYDHMKTVYDTVFEFANNFGKADQASNLLFYGGTGLGKTFLSNCVANKLLTDGYSVIYMTAIELFSTYSKYEFSKDSEYNDDVISQITDCDLLIIDDLGTELTNSFTLSKAFFCINDRLLKNKSTIISTNFTLEKILETYTDRVFSRIMQSYKPIKFFGENIRLLDF